MRRIALLAVAVATVSSIVPARADTVPVGPANPDCRPVATASLPYDCENRMIAVNGDGARLDATFYVPKSASPSSPVPVVLKTHGYGGWHRSPGDIANAALLASNGYAVLAYTSRGFGRSDGTVQLEAPEWEVRDAMDLISWLANPPNTGNRVILDGPNDPRVGMFGGSYAGGIQLLAAAHDFAPRLDAITPQITWNDLRYSLAANGVIHHGWIDLLYPSGKYSGYLGPIGSVPPPVVSTEGVATDQDIQVLTSYLANDSVDMPVPYSDGTTNSYDYLARRSVGPRAARVTTPTLFIQGQRDSLFTLTETFRTYAGISTPEAHKKILVFSAGHGYGDLAGERAMINERILDWFAWYLKRTSPRPASDPRVEAWRPWVTNASGQTTANFGTPSLPAGWPAIEARAAVSLTGPATATLANVVAPTSSSETTNFQGNTGSPAFDALPGLTSQDWAASVAPGTTIFGTPMARFRISSGAPEAIVFAKLWDVGPGGRTLVHRLVTPARVRGGVGDFCSGYMPAPPPPPTASVAPTEVCVQLAGIAWKVEPGHSLALTLATSNATHFSSRYPGTYEISNVRLELPTVPAF